MEPIPLLASPQGGEGCVIKKFRRATEADAAGVVFLFLSFIHTFSSPRSYQRNEGQESHDRRNGFTRRQEHPCHGVVPDPASARHSCCAVQVAEHGATRMPR